MTNTQSKAALRACIDMARRGFSQEDFKRFALMSFKFGEQYLDLIAAMELLKMVNVVEVSQGSFRLLGMPSSDWVKGQISSGGRLVWDLVDSVPQNYRSFNPDQIAQEQLGLQGELAVMERLMETVLPDLHHRIRHVSLISDHFGFDIESPSRFEERGLLALEVKTTSRPGDRFRFFLSRNEYRAGLDMENWHLVFVQMVGSRFEILGHLPHLELRARVPKNMDPHVVWETVSGTLHKNDLFPGLPE